jgi:putative Holliday junction resolvase
MIVCADIGLKRIGVAFSPDGSLSLPLNAIMRKNRDQAARELSVILKEKNAKTLVVGLSLGGASEDEMRRRITHFVSLLDFDGEVVYEDEFGSSKEALGLGVVGLTKNKDGKLDSLSAKIILDRWLARKRS